MGVLRWDGFLFKTKNKAWSAVTEEANVVSPETQNVDQRKRKKRCDMSVSVQQGAPTQKRCLNTAELSDQGEKLTADIAFFKLICDYYYNYLCYRINVVIQFYFAIFE